MPPKPSWYADLPRIRRALKALPLVQPTTLDRSAIQDLFGIKARHANNLMSKFMGTATGSGHVVLLSDLLERIDEMSAPGGVAAAEIQRKQKNKAHLEKQQTQVRPRKIPRPPPPPAGAALPEGIRQIAPGQVLIEYSTPEELLSRVLAISESSIKDFAAFSAGLEFPSDRNGGCTSETNTATAAQAAP